MDRLKIIYDGTEKILPTEIYTTSSSWTTQTAGTRQTKVQAVPFGQDMPYPDGSILMDSGTHKIGLADDWYLTMEIYTTGGGQRRAGYFKLYTSANQWQFDIGGDVPAGQCRIFGARCMISDTAWYGIYRDCIDSDGITHYGQVLLLDSVLTDGLVIDPYTGDSFPPTAGGWGDWDRSSDEVQPSTIPTSIMPIAMTYGINVYYLNRPALQSFAEFLWGQNEVLWRELWAKYQNIRFNPIGAIIACFMMPSQFFLSGTATTSINIAGTRVSPIGGSCRKVTAGQFRDITYNVAVPEFYGSYMDYTNRKLMLHLPYIGVLPINPIYCVGGGLSITYRCDQLNGNLCAFVTATNRSGRSETILTATGNCAYQVPLTGHTDGQIEMLGSLVSTAAVLAATDGAALAAGGVININEGKEQTTTFGNHAGNPAACTNLSLYLELIYDEPSNPATYTALRGRPADIAGTVGNFHGFTIFSDVHPDGISRATDAEKEMIAQMLKRGVII